MTHEESAPYRASSASSAVLTAGDNVADPMLLGGKGANLVLIGSAGLDVPAWCVLSAEFYRQLFTDPLRSGDPDLLRAAVEAMQLPAEVLREMEDVLDSLGIAADEPLAVRSSAVGEDGAGASYAGQLDSFLFVRRAGLADAIRGVWRSAVAERVTAYRRSRGLPPLMPGVAVIVQRMVDTNSAGVAFGLDPLTGDRSVVMMSAVVGLGEGLVSGELDADRFTVKDTGEVMREIAHKDRAVRFDRARGSGTVIESLPEEMRDASVLTDSQAQEIAAAVRKLEAALGRAQDVEWGYADGRLYILQTRPVTATGGNEGTTRRVWDNSNIIESYAGVTTPLTFSFIDGVYTEVYKEFTRILGVDEETIARNLSVFRMLGLIRGRVYYNLLNWYRILALLPGYRVNAAFMEGMMGVKERLEEQPQIEAPAGNAKLRLLASIWKLIGNLRRLPRAIEAFTAHLNRTLAPLEGRTLADENIESLIAHYRRLERELLQRWRVPILNDFYTMIFHGVLKRLVARWKIDSSGTLDNDLLSGQGGIISTEPIVHLRTMARIVSSRQGLRERVLNEENASALHVLDADEVAGPAVREYLRRFGSRYPGELKLETITPAERPPLVVEMIRPYLRDAGGVEVADGAGRIRAEAERRVKENLRGPIRRWLFGRVLNAARTRVMWRENLRFERTRVFAVVRRIVSAMGERLAERDLLDRPRDVFMLGIDELFALAEGRALAWDVKSAVAARGAELERYRAESAPPDRFATVGPVATSSFESASSEVPVLDDDPTTLRGVACSPGIVRARVAVVTDPGHPPDLRGRILVAERTDPGWTPLFPLASGILVERGSLLSHSAIVAREIGVPAVVAVPGLLARLRDGELVEMDGARGTIRRLEEIGEDRSEK